MLLALPFQSVRPQEAQNGADQVKSLQEKLDHIVIPKIEFKHATVSEAIGVLHKASVDFDTTEKDPSRKGVNIVLKLELPSATGGVSPADTKIDLSLANVTLSKALKSVADLAGLKAVANP